MPYDIRVAKLRPPEGKNKRVETDGIKAKTCKNCFAVYPANEKICPYCQHEPETSEREIKQISGELALITKTKISELKNDLAKLTATSLQFNWKNSAKWLKLYEKHGEIIFQYKEELGMPGWVRRQVNELIIKKEALDFINKQ